jgi:hypothetical protein
MPVISNLYKFIKLKSDFMKRYAPPHLLPWTGIRQNDDFAKDTKNIPVPDHDSGCFIHDFRAGSGNKLVAIARYKSLECTRRSS